MSIGFGFPNNSPGYHGGGATTFVSAVFTGITQLSGQTFTGGAMVVNTFEDTVSEQFVIGPRAGQTFTGGSMVIPTFGS